MITKSYFDTYEAREVSLYTLQNDEVEVGILDFGATVQSVKLHTPRGMVNICVGYDTLEGYLHSYCGVTVGRVANRIQNSCFTLGGKTYHVTPNEGKNCLHGGTEGFNRRFFDAEVQGDSLILSMTSPDGDMGFPGTLDLKVIYTLLGRELSVRYLAKSDRDTVFAPTCHAYFNLNGGGSVMETELQIRADGYTPTDRELIPLGFVAKVEGTPLDFRTPKTIGRDFAALGGKTYDHNFALLGGVAAVAHSDESGVTLTMSTDLPGVQLYVGNLTKTTHGGGNGFCLEPQFFPNAVNTPAFETPVLPADTEIAHSILYRIDF